MVNDACRRLRRCFAARTPEPSTTVAANDAASSNDVCRKYAAAVNDRRRKKRRNGQRPGQRRAAEFSPTTPKPTRKRQAFRGGLLASSGACANLCCRVLRTGTTGQVSCFCALRVRAAPSRLIAPSRPPINRLYIPRRHCLRLLCLGRSLFGLKQGMLLFQFFPSK